MKREYAEIMREAAKAGAAEMLKVLKPEADSMSQREAYAAFGIAFVKKNESEGNLTIIRKGSAKNSTKYYSRAELIELVAARNVCRNIISIETNKQRTATHSHLVRASEMETVRDTLHAEVRVHQKSHGNRRREAHGDDSLTRVRG